MAAKEELAAWLADTAGLAGKKLDVALAKCEDELIENVAVTNQS